ncbi:MAG: 1-deoxy-D-xylulose-5-phosphate reductoisomerase [Bacteroidales bacterium]|nr:1-deoxy-D-xylulose-5-phosphate reductoisomerase [Bacteroidales bacterium]
MAECQKQSLAILGSTGSIGVQTLEVVKHHPERFEVYALTANNNADLLIAQARAFEPEVVVIANQALYTKVKDSLADLPIKVWTGTDSVADVATMQPVDTVVVALVGYSALQPVIKAIEANKKIALANKECLVVAGQLVTSLALKYHCPILPIDSEHSAVFQCLLGEQETAVDRIILTASGGPFRTINDLSNVTPAQALNHPTWNMGAKITIDSASMMNKGFEVMEAKWLFGIDVDHIDVVVHPQSIIHSLVQFKDGSVKAQLGNPDMRIPIQLALTYPERIETEVKKLDLTTCGNLTFEKPDKQRFRNLSLAYEAMHQGGNIPCALNAANEIAVHAFLNEKISFLGMSDLIANVISRTPFIATPTYDNYVETDKLARQMTEALINNH